MDHRIKWWQLVWSYTREIVLETVEQANGARLYVSLKKGRLMLSTDETIYSWDDRYLNFVWGIERIVPDKRKASQALLLGMGLGAIPFILQSKFHITPQFTAVEIDPDIIRLAQKYSLSRLQNPPKVICADATEAVHYLDGAFEMIFIDICQEDHIPGGCESQAFLEQIQQLLSPNGVLLYNRFYSTYRDQFKTDKFFKSVFKEVFPKGQIIDQGGTCLLVNDGSAFQKLKGE
jgi:spermidine synthase